MANGFRQDLQTAGDVLGIFARRGQGATLGQLQQGRQEQDIISQLSQLQDPSQSPLLGQLATLNPEAAQQFTTGGIFGQLSQQREQRLFDDANKFNTQIQQGDIAGLTRGLEQRIQSITLAGGDPADTQEVLTDIQSGNLTGAAEKLGAAVQLGQQTGFLQAPTAEKVAELTAGQREFASLTEGLAPEQKNQAALIELGLSPRAVGSAIQTISDQGIAEQIGDVKATIKEREKFGELTGSSRSKAIDSGFAKITKIDKNIKNLDRAIAAVEAGAGTGAIERRFPSIRAAAVELDQIQGELALDVIGAVTFGALSQGELDLAKQIALPTGLEGPQLIQHLQDRKVAQDKLRSYFKEQINFLDQGGSVAGFMREKERQTDQGVEQSTTQIEQPAAPIEAAQGPQEGQTATNPQTGQQAVFTNGQWQVQ